MGLVAVLGNNEHAEAAVRRHLRGFDVVTVEGFDVAGDPAFSDARVIVICTGTIGTGEQTAIRNVIETFPIAQVLLVTRATAKNVRLLAEIPEILHDVVGIDEVATVLRRRVAALLAEHYLDRAVARIVGVLELSPVAKLFVRRAWCVSPPPRSVAQVLREVGVHASTLRDNWPFDAQPKALVDWAVLGRAVAERRRGASWPVVAARVGASQRRLKQIAQRRLDCSLQDVDKRDEEWVERQFRAWLDDAVFDADSGEASA